MESSGPKIQLKLVETHVRPTYACRIKLRYRIFIISHIVVVNNVSNILRQF